MDNEQKENSQYSYGRSFDDLVAASKNSKSTELHNHIDKSSSNSYAQTEEDNPILKVFHAIGQGIDFICGAYGAYKIPDAMFSYFGWVDTLASIIGIANLCCVCIFVFGLHEKKK